MYLKLLNKLYTFKYITYKHHLTKINKIVKEASLVEDHRRLRTWHWPTFVFKILKSVFSLVNQTYPQKSFFKPYLKMILSLCTKLLH